jgi:hypothetical protein
MSYTVTYTQDGVKWLSRVFTDKTGVAGFMKVDPKTVARWIKNGGVVREDIECGLEVGYVEKAVLSTLVKVHKSDRGCPSGENRFIKLNT